MLGEYKAALSGLFAQAAFPEDPFYIRNVFHDRKSVIHGADECFHYFKGVVVWQSGYIPPVILDRRFSHNDTFEGIPASPPLKYQPSVDEKQSGLVVISLTKQQYLDDVVQTVRQMKFHHIISLMGIYEIHNPFRLPRELEDTGF